MSIATVITTHRHRRWAPPDIHQPHPPQHSANQDRIPKIPQTTAELGKRLCAPPWGALDALAEAKGIYEAIGNKNGEASALNELGTLQTVMGDFSDASESLAQAVGIHRSLGGRFGEADSLNRLGLLTLVSASDPEAAGQLFLQALEMATDLSFPLEIARASEGLGMVAHARGDVGAATSRYQQANTIYATLGAGRCARLGASLPA